MNDKSELLTAGEIQNRLEVGDLELEFWDKGYVYGYEQKSERGWLRPSCLPISAILLLIVLVVLWPLLSQSKQHTSGESKEAATMWEECRATIVESIPEGMKYSNFTPHLSTFQGWKDMIKSAGSSIDIASFYWTLRGSDVIPDASDWQGEEIFKDLLEAGRDRSIALRIVQNQPSHLQPPYDTDHLKEKANAQVRSLNMQKLVGAGILHTKLWIIDGKHMYIGSANMDWRALTQVKELGVIISNCSRIVQDVSKMFSVYWMMAQTDAVIPDKWPKSLSTIYNLQHPMKIRFDQVPADVVLVSSPPEFCPSGRSSDLEGLLHVIESAEQYIYIAVMDYTPSSLYTLQTQFWPVIDDALRKAAIENKIQVRLLISNWTHTRPSIANFLHSLVALNEALPDVSIQVKWFVVPPLSKKIPYTRVNHNKYMVTDNAAFIGTSNWSKDYFLWTGGISIIVNQTSFQKEMRDIFLRDWESEYAVTLA